MPHYRLIPDIYLSERGSGVASVRFDITGANGSHPSSINRFWTAHGFMGNGVSIINDNISGINENQPLLSEIIEEGDSIFIPRGDKKAGYLFSGQVLNESVPGDITYNNNTGWGAVYGIVASTGFYQNQYDTCLVDNPSWSGFVGGIPNPTGTDIYWPIKGSGLGLRITGVSYFFSGYENGIISDPSNILGAGMTAINDVLYNGQTVIGNVSMSDASYLITGYTLSNTYQRGTGLYLSLSTLNAYTATADTNFPDIDGSTLTVSAIAWKKPSGVIHHVENINNQGYRLLPNYAFPNNDGINTYLPVTGGKFPGMSTQNGMELYLTLSWSGK
jgi:hypothetical protein